VRRLAARAEELESAGFTTQAEAAYVLAVSSNEPEYVLKYARFMRRTGRLERAFQINDGLLQSRQFIASDVPEIIAQRATVLTNMGIIRRKQGRLLDSSKCLDEAVRTARLSGPTGRESLAYALDNWGATLLRQGEVTRSRDAYEEALNWRRQGDDERGIAQSLINLARLGKQTGDLDQASKQAAEAIAIFEKIGDQRGIAEARELRGEALLALGSFAEARRELEIALDRNEKGGYSDGISVASAQLARVALEMNDVPAAAAAARRSLAESVRSSNQEGIAIARQILGLVERRQGDLVASVAFLTQALSSFANSGDVAREAASHLELAKTLVEQRKYGEAANELRLAEEASDRSGNSSIRASIERYLQGLGSLEAFATLKT
jgi:tetratricopeptide (TPR) repeat protein